MSIVKTPSIKYGETISTTDMNNYFTDLSVASGLLTTDNLKSENTSQFHLYFPGSPTNYGIDEILDGDGSAVINSNT